MKTTAEYKREAAVLEVRSPGWIVLWGDYTRKFWAFAGWIASEAIVIAATTVQEMERRMRLIEAHYPQRPTWTGQR
ncbi:hypothetical protein [Actinomadura alba]|uniref:Uncharacterized protein n=1 Tax=Actinomadura alba TaxID=406431 RepID=A0ABR7LW80_9ACTN|nr:hypothetical protein [Actinomadura alba]MBC6469102.1 hypothetical protein [Actinomadura alba]